MPQRITLAAAVKRVGFTVLAAPLDGGPDWQAKHEIAERARGEYLLYLTYGTRACPYVSVTECAMRFAWYHEFSNAVDPGELISWLEWQHLWRGPRLYHIREAAPGQLTHDFMAVFHEHGTEVYAITRRLTADRFLDFLDTLQPGVMTRPRWEGG